MSQMKRVMMVACNEYRQLGHSNLPGVLGDALLWRRHFANNDRVEFTILANPDRHAFTRALGEFQPHLLIYSGHGVRVRQGGFAIESLALPGSSTIERVDDAEMAVLRETTGVSVFLDCCHAAGVLDSSRGIRQLAGGDPVDYVPPEGSRTVGLIDASEMPSTRSLSLIPTGFRSEIPNSFAFASAGADEFAWETTLGGNRWGLVTTAVLATASCGIDDQTRLRMVMRAYGDLSRQSTPVASSIGQFGRGVLFE